MADPKVPLKTPWIAGVLAYLIPGAGHFYQGRMFKGVLYSVCILGTFFYGMHLGEWLTVFYRAQPKTWGYFSQVLVGLPALPALVQAKRYEPPDPHRHHDGRRRSLEEPVRARFSGNMMRTLPDGTTESDRISGTLELRMVPGDYGPEPQGTFTGSGTRMGPLSLRLAGPIEIGPKIYASEEVTPRVFPMPDDRREFASNRRYLMARVVDEAGGRLMETGVLEGTIPRSFWNWFQVPLSDKAVERLYGDLGKRYELALVFTWIAGLLNILAIWDALEGPAYGYGHEKNENKKKPEGEEDPNEQDGPRASAKTPEADKNAPASPDRGQSKTQPPPPGTGTQPPQSPGASPAPTITARSQK